MIYRAVVIEAKFPEATPEEGRVQVSQRAIIESQGSQDTFQGATEGASDAQLGVHGCLRVSEVRNGCQQMRRSEDMDTSARTRLSEVYLGGLWTGTRRFNWDFWDAHWFSDMKDMISPHPTCQTGLWGIHLGTKATFLME